MIIAEHLKLHLKKEPNSCFANNYFKAGLKASQEDISLQFVLIKYEKVTYMCQNISKAERPYFQALKEASEEIFENSMYHHETIKNS